MSYRRSDATPIRTIQPEPASYGWRVRNNLGANRERMASAAYRSEYRQLEGYARQFGQTVNGRKPLLGCYFGRRGLCRT